MLWIATVHHQNPLWIKLQLRFLLANTSGPFNIYAVCNGVEPGLMAHCASKVYRTKFRSTGSQNHADNLNFLAREIVREASLKDHIVFMDSDAFPVSPEWRAKLDRYLSDTPLAAVRRDHGPSPMVPHPLFCATTVGFWKELKGNWSPFAWKAADGTIISDTGSNLLKRLRERNVTWRVVSKTNATFDPHPVCFSLYGNVIYHHGAGSRPEKDVHSSGSLGLYARTLSDIMLRLIEDHNDFHLLFTEGKYRDVVEAAMRKRGLSDELLWPHVKA